MNRLIPLAAFIAGLLAVGWVALGYLGQQPLALAMTLLIAAVYLGGTCELWRFRRGTAGLNAALAALHEAPAELGPWLDRLPPALRPAVRLRVQGERVALPGPALTPYLAGLLVLLGMLGTFLGMMVTLQGTGAALDAARDMAGIRESLSAPVRGLGLAFGVSVAGVAASAMLGLMAALLRRERALAAQQLDTRIAGPLRAFSRTQQREAAFALLQQQAGAVPALVERLQAMTDAIEKNSLALHERLGSSQALFHDKAEAAYTGLAASVARALQASLADSTRSAAATLQPVVEATMAGIARESAGLHDALTRSVREHLEGLTAHLDSTSASVAQHWQGALAEHQHGSQALLQALDARHAQAAEQQAAHTAAASEQLLARLDAAVQSSAAQWRAAADHQQQAGEAQAARTQQALDAAVQRFDNVAQAFAQRATGLAQGLEDGVGTRLEAAVGQLTRGLEGAVGDLTTQWRDALAEQARADAQWTRETQAALQGAAAGVGQQGEALLQALQAAQAEDRTHAAAQEAERLAAWTGALAALREGLQQQWTQVGEENAARHRQIADTLAQTAHEITAQAEAQARGTLEQIGELVQAAADAPRAAAGVVAELRQKLADSMARDNAAIEERTRLLGTLSTLLDAVNHATAEQRGAIDALVSTSATLLERVAGRFDEQVNAQAERLDAAAAHLGAGTVEVASLGEAFGGALQHFGHSSEKLAAQLERIEGALAQSQARSDEQLAYTVAQARELIDLSLMSQKQIIEDLQQIATRQAQAQEPARAPTKALPPAGTEAA